MFVVCGYANSWVPYYSLCIYLKCHVFVALFSFRRFILSVKTGIPQIIMNSQDFEIVSNFLKHGKLKHTCNRL